MSRSRWQRDLLQETSVCPLRLYAHLLKKCRQQTWVEQGVVARASNAAPLLTPSFFVTCSRAKLTHLPAALRFGRALSDRRSGQQLIVDGFKHGPTHKPFRRCVEACYARVYQHTVFCGCLVCVCAYLATHHHTMTMTMTMTTMSSLWMLPAVTRDPPCGWML